jgi:alcohol dehydrogenase (NADP+)
MGYPDDFLGFQVVDPAKYKEFRKQSFQPRPFGDYDVDVEIDCCGLCSSDIHTINGGWGQKNFPLTVGHSPSTQMSPRYQYDLRH